MQRNYIVNSKGEYWNWVTRKWQSEKVEINRVAVFQEMIISNNSDSTRKLIQEEVD